jgi:hypothetical protein
MVPDALACALRRQRHPILHPLNDALNALPYSTRRLWLFRPYRRQGFRDDRAIDR